MQSITSVMLTATLWDSFMAACLRVLCELIRTLLPLLADILHVQILWSRKRVLLAGELPGDLTIKICLTSVLLGSDTLMPRKRKTALSQMNGANVATSLISTFVAMHAASNAGMQGD